MQILVLRLDKLAWSLFFLNLFDPIWPLSKVCCSELCSWLIRRNNCSCLKYHLCIISTFMMRKLMSCLSSQVLNWGNMPLYVSSFNNPPTWYPCLHQLSGVLNLSCRISSFTYCFLSDCAIDYVLVVHFLHDQNDEDGHEFDLSSAIPHPNPISIVVLQFDNYEICQTHPRRLGGVQTRQTQT